MTKQLSTKTKQDLAFPEISSEEKYKLVKDIVGKGSTDAELQLLMYTANKYDLDPLVKEIWLVKRNQKDAAIIMVSRDGYLKIAHRTGKFDGLHSGVIRDDKNQIVSAWCEVWRKDMTHSFKSEVAYNEYRQQNFIWQKYPSAMLIKVAEVFALKRAFSISGLVTVEEMDMNDKDQEDEGEDYAEEEAVEQLNERIQRDDANDDWVENLPNEEVAEIFEGELVEEPAPEVKEKAQEFFEKEKEVRLITQAQIKKIYNMIKEAYPDKDAEVIWDNIKGNFNREHRTEITLEEAKQTIDTLQEKIDKKVQA